MLTSKTATMHRRGFLASTAAALGLSQFAAAADAIPDVKVTRVVSFTLPTRRAKIAGKNSHKDVHGDTSRDRMVRIFTNVGIEGIGNCRAGRDELAKLLGRSPLDVHHPDQRRIVALGTGTMPLWDLVGKLLDKPVYELLGGAGPDKVPVYDGSIYFADLLPQYEDRWRDRFRAEIDMGLDLGHRAFKVKVGRGFKWMRRDAGDARDIQVIELIRRHAGPDVLIGMDANNGYDLAGTKAFLEHVGDKEIAFVEEMFPETVAECVELKRYMKSKGWKTYLADGESQSDIDAFRPLVDAKAIDILQGDMNRFGFEGILAEAALARLGGALVAPHNWGSLIGYYMQLHIGRAIDNFYRAEHDPLSTDVLIADGYAIKDGLATVPDSPGFGIRLDERKFAAEAEIHFDIKA